MIQKGGKKRKHSHEILLDAKLKRLIGCPLYDILKILYNKTYPVLLKRNANFSRIRIHILTIWWSKLNAKVNSCSMFNYTYFLIVNIHIAEMHSIFELAFRCGNSHKIASFDIVWYLEKLKYKLHANGAMQAIRIALNVGRENWIQHQKLNLIQYLVDDSW